LVEGGNVKAKDKKEGNPAVQVGLLAAFGVAAFLLLHDEETTIAPPPTEAPQLFASAAPTCPQADPAAAKAFAQEQRDLGDTKRERLPFVVEEGVAAVGLFQMAAACFEKAGAPKRAREVDELAQGLKRDLVDDFRARRIRLSHVLAVEDYELARKDLQVLTALTAGKKGPYVEWLAEVAKQVEGKQ
jgi:hypothetical protein